MFQVALGDFVSQSVRIPYARQIVEESEDEFFSGYSDPRNDVRFAHRSLDQCAHLRGDALSSVRAACFCLVYFNKPFFAAYYP